MPPSLYEQIGGEPAVDAAVDLFYVKVLADDRINHFFEDVDMKGQAKHQKLFLTFAFGGLPSYPGKNMQAAHQKFVDNYGLNDSHFDAVLENLGETLTELGVPDHLIAKAAAITESLRSDVLCK